MLTKYFWMFRKVFNVGSFCNTLQLALVEGSWNCLSISKLVSNMSKHEFYLRFIYDILEVKIICPVKRKVNLVVLLLNKVA